MSFAESVPTCVPSDLRAIYATFRIRSDSTRSLLSLSPFGFQNVFFDLGLLEKTRPRKYFGLKLFARSFSIAFYARPRPSNEKRDV